jgi:hypothetical protein
MKRLHETVIGRNEAIQFFTNVFTLFYYPRNKKET